MKRKVLKGTVLPDGGDSLVARDGPRTVGRKHDTTILPRLIPNDESGSVLAADKGYEDDKRRGLCQKQGIEPLMKPREFGVQDEGTHARMESGAYNQRQKIESVVSAVKRKDGDKAPHRVGYRPCRDILAKMGVHNWDRITYNISLPKIKANVRLWHDSMRF